MKEEQRVGTLSPRRRCIGAHYSWDSREEIERFPDGSVSVIGWAETMASARGEEEELEVQSFLATFEIVDVNLEAPR